MRPNWRWLLLIVLAVGASYWKLAFTKQFSLLAGYESANQAYSWNVFFARSLQQGMLPLWDPYGHSGRSLIGEMQSGPFYPPKLLLYFSHLSVGGRLSPAVYNWFYLLSAVLGAWFMFLLAREMELQPFAAYFSAVIFVVGGFVGRIVWPHLHDSAIWLPPLILLAARALRASSLRTSLRYAAVAGLALGMTILAGGLHLVIMQGLAVAGLVLYFGLMRRECPRPQAIAVLLVIGGVALAAGAVQLLPSMEYSPLALRYLGGSSTAAAGERIPYGLLGDNFLPRALWGFVVGYPYNGGNIGTVETSPYLGLLTFLLGLAGVWRNWSRPWVRYLAVLLLLSFFYSLGDSTLVHGLSYTLVPFIWMAREGGRFIYLTHFALALLAGFGVETLFASGDVRELFSKPLRTCGWILAGVAAILTIPALIGQPGAAEWGYLAFFQGCCAFALLTAVIRYGWRTPAARFLLVALTLSDLASINTTIASLKTMNAGDNFMQALLDSERMAQFFHAQSGVFRVHFEAEWAPSIGEAFGVYTTGGMAATSLADYSDFVYQVPHSLDMLGTRYLIRSASSKEPGPVYSDHRWKVYEAVTKYFPHAWMVGKAIVEPDSKRALGRMAFPDFNPERMAVVGDAVDLADNLPAAIPAEVSWTTMTNNRVEMVAKAPVRGLLVVSEIYYPGWHVSVNGEEVALHKANGVLRGVVVPPGENRIAFWYRPISVYAGAAISLFCFLVVLGWWMLTPNDKMTRFS